MLQTNAVTDRSLLIKIALLRNNLAPSLPNRRLRPCVAQNPPSLSPELLILCPRCINLYNNVAYRSVTCPPPHRFVTRLHYLLFAHTHSRERKGHTACFPDKYKTQQSGTFLWRSLLASRTKGTVAPLVLYGCVYNEAVRVKEEESSYSCCGLWDILQGRGSSYNNNKNMIILLCFGLSYRFGLWGLLVFM